MHEADPARRDWGQGAVALLGGGEVGRLRFLDHRADPIDLGTAPECPPYALHDFVVAWQRQGAGVDRPAPWRFFGQSRHVEIAIGGHHQGARDRRRAHQQRIGAVALGGESEPLLDAEPVLFVDDDEAEVAEFDIRLQQRVGADDDRG